jgi:hypothetical protein
MELELLGLRDMLMLTGLIQISVGLLWLVQFSPREKEFMATTAT